MRVERLARLWQKLNGRYCAKEPVTETAIVRWTPYPTWRRRLAMAAAGSAGLLFLSEGVLARFAVSPPAPCRWVAALQPKLPGLGTVKSVEELDGIRHRVDGEIDRCDSNLALAARIPEALSRDTLAVQQEAFVRYRQGIETRLQREAEARQHWDEALSIGVKAIELAGETKGGSPSRAAEIKNWRETQSLWQQAIDRLEEIPDDSFLTDYVIEKKKEYKNYLAVVSDRLEIAQLATGFIFSGDTDRDGTVSDRDYKGRQVWSWQSGALMLFNNDDDDGNGTPDWEDNKVNGTADEEDLAIARVRVTSGFAGSQFIVKVNDKSRPYVNLFQKTDAGWQAIDPTGTQPLADAPELILGIEAKQFAYGDWNGVATLEAIAQRNGRTITGDRIQVRVSPWIMSPNTDPVSDFFVSDVGSNREFVAQLQELIPQTGATLNVVPGGPTWMQDTMEIGYVQFPHSSALKTVSSVLKGNRGMSQDDYARSLLKSNFGWFQMGQPRGVPAGHGLPDWYGNLEVTPPLPGYPLGRFYYGRSGDVTLHPDVVSFLKAQDVQGPPVEIDTSWLLIGHVDEIISFIPTSDGQYLMTIASPEAGVQLLQELAEKGYGDSQLNRGLSTQTTVKSALGDREFIEHNLRLQREFLNPTIDKLKREFKLTDSQIIRVPSLYATNGSAWWPSMVNSVVVNGHLFVSDPKGVLLNEVDLTQEVFRNLVSTSGLKVHFMNDRYYHELKGNTHCATNSARQGISQPFWERLSDRLRKE
ncbi:MAG TPA: protein-arginine deiminase [Oscillatoriales cyanobacterium M59_W2019_021]|nr:protein-arginine deiminase [Oscillatoriales cyanobacterium M59_W2019_021]